MDGRSNALITAVKELTGDDGGFWDAVGRTFDLMDVAEEAVSTMQKEYPKRKDVIWNSFILLRSPILPQRSPDKLHALHYKQILRSISEGVPITNLDTPTLVEASVMIATTGQKVPINHDVIRLVTSDAEIAMLYGFERSPKVRTGLESEHWSMLTRGCQKIWKEKEGHTRAQLAFKKYKEKDIDYYEGIEHE